MNQPLAPALGNGLEVAESMEVLCNAKGGPLAELTVALGGVALANAGLAADVEAGAKAMSACLADGRAAERFGRMVAEMGGPVQFVENWQRFIPEATVIREVTAEADGYISAIDGEALGLCVVGLGGGRQVESDVIDPSVGLSEVAVLGARVTRGQPLARVHAAREDAARRGETEVRAAFTISSQRPKVPELIHERIR